MSEIKLPAWAKLLDPSTDKVCGIIEVDSDAAYAEWLNVLFASDPKPVDQYWLEVAYQCIKMDVQMSIEGTEIDPSRAGKATQINMTRADRWALKNYPKGKGITAATQGREARDHYKRIRGRIPFSA